MKKILNNKSFIIFTLLVPGIALYAFSIFIPIGLSFKQSLTDASSMNMNVVKMVGADNYINILFHDSIFWVSALHAVILGLCYAFLQHPLAIFFAILINKTGGKLEKIFRTVFFLPCVISIAVTTMMWKSMYNQQFGLFNQLLKAIGLDKLQTDWLGNPNTAFPALLLMILWQGFGMGFLLYYTGLQRIPGEIYESAEIDGATGICMANKITIPLLRPIIRVAVTLGMINALKTMEAVYISTEGGPGNTTEFLANYLYRIAFKNYQWGYANALAITFLVICLVTAYTFNKLMQKDIGEY